MENNEEQVSSCSSTQNHFFLKWINLQQQDLSELLRSLNPILEEDPNRESQPSRLTEKNIQHFKDYVEIRAQFSHDRASELFAPSWCSSLENSLLWIGGCRPSLFIRHLYAKTGSEFESQLSDYLQTGDETTVSRGLLPSQLAKVDDLRRKTIKEEEKLTSCLASLQEEIVEEPFATISKNLRRLCELDSNSDKALDEHEKSMGSLVEEADKLRMNVLKELIDILTPWQAVDFLASSKKLYLCMHEWGKTRDQMRK